MVACPCLPLLKRVMVLEMLSLFCGSNAAFLVIVLNLLRLVNKTMFFLELFKSIALPLSV